MKMAPLTPPFQKSMDRNTTLRMDSFLPPGLKKNFSFGQL